MKLASARRTASSAGGLFCLLLLTAAAPASQSPATEAPPPSKAAGSEAALDLPHTYLSRQQASEVLPLPLRFSTFTPELGRWVEYEVSGEQRRTRVRISHVAKVDLEGVAANQIELDFLDLSPRLLVVLWISDPPEPVLGRFAAWVRPHAPVSIPVALRIDAPELRGEEVSSTAVELKGAFAGPAHRLQYRDDEGTTAEIVTTSAVPLLGVESVKVADERWVAVKTGTGARVGLTAVPITMPRLPEPDSGKQAGKED